MGVSEIGGYLILGVLIIRILLFRVLYWDPLILTTTHIGFKDDLNKFRGSGKSDSKTRVLGLLSGLIQRL